MTPARRSPGRAASGIRAALALAALGTAAGLALRFLVPVEPPDPAFLARVEQWKALAPELERGQNIERATRRP